MAYCAGVVDSDGCIGVKHSDYRVRILGDCTTPTYAAYIQVKQVERQAVDIMHEYWGGYFGLQRSYAKRGRPGHCWQVHSAAAGRALAELLPYLRIKRAQAENALEVCRLVRMGTRRFPVPEIVPGEPMVTVAEAAARLGKSYEVVYQAVRKGTVPAVCGKRSGRKPSVFIPESYLPVWTARGRSPSRSPETIAALEACFRRAKELNRVGI